MKKLIQEKQWAELKAYCLEKLLAGIENAEEIVDTFIEELAKKADVSPNPWKTVMESTPRGRGEMFKQEYLGSFEPDRSSTTWRFLEGGEEKDIQDALSFAKMDKTPFFTHVALTDNAPDEGCKTEMSTKEADSGEAKPYEFWVDDYKVDIIPDSTKSSTDRYSEEQFERRTTCYDSFATEVKRSKISDVVKEVFEEQHSNRLDEEVKKIGTNYFEKSVLYAVKNVNEVSGVEQAYISDSTPDEAVISVNSHPGSNFSTIQVSRMLTRDCMSCNLISDNEPTRDQVAGRRQTVFKVYEIPF